MKKNGLIRQKRINFSQVSNVVLRDKTLSLKAKGLYALIQSYITLENFTLYKDFLLRNSAEGRDAFNSTWKELLERKVLIQHKMKDENGRFYYEFELLDEPLNDTQQDLLQSTISQSNFTKSNSKGADFPHSNIEHENEEPLINQQSHPYTGNPYVVEKPLTENPYMETPHMDNSEVVDPYLYNNTIDNNIIQSNTKKNNITTTTSCSFSQSLENTLVDSLSNQDTKLEEVVQVYVDNYGTQPIPAVIADLKRRLVMFELDCVIYAIDVASSKGKGYDYVIGIFRNWIKNQIKTFDDVYKFENGE